MLEKAICFIARLLTGAQARWSGMDPPSPDRPHIYFANHTSNLDFILVWSALPALLRARTRPAAARDYWSVGFRRRVAEKCFRAVLIERKNVTRSCNPLTDLLAVLDAGESVIIFPEGGRVEAGERLVGDFKGGLYHLAKARPDLPLVPVYLENLNRVLPKGEVLPVPMLCSATFGAPLALRAEEAKTEFLHRAREGILQLAKPPDQPEPS